MKEALNGYFEICYCAGCIIKKRSNIIRSRTSQGPLVIVVSSPFSTPVRMDDHGQDVRASEQLREAKNRVINHHQCRNKRL